MFTSFFTIKSKIIEIWNHAGFQKYFKNTGWMMFGQMFNLVISFFIGAWVCRYLGPSNFGIISYSTAFVALFGFVASLGVDGILNRELIKYPEKRDQLIGTAFVLKIIGSIVAFILVCISTFIIQSSSIIKLFIIIFSFSFIIQSLNVISTFFQASVKSKNTVKASLISSLISTILKIFFILSGAGLIWLIIIITLDVLWQAIGFVLMYHSIGLKIKDWKYDSLLARKILSNSWLLMLSTASYFIFLKIDQVMIGIMLGEKEVGLYAAAVRFVEIWYFIPSIVCTSLFPAIINAKKTNKLLYEDRIKKLYYLMIIMALFIAVFITIISKWIIILMFGNAYLASVSVLRIYIWSSIGFFWGSAVGQFLMAENMVRTIFISYLISMLVNVFLNIIFIPRIGLNGAALATLISYFIIPIIVLIRVGLWKSIEKDYTMG